MSRLVVVCTLVAGALCAADVRADEVLYRECFGNDYVGATNYRSPADYNWQTFHGGFGLAADVYTGSETPVPSYHQSVTNEPGRPQDLDNVNAGASYSQVNGFYAFGAVYPTYTDRALLYTDEYTIDRSAWNITTFSWRQGNDLDIDPALTRVAVRIGGAWYVSTQTFASDDMPEGEFATSANVALHTFLFTTDAAAWRPLLFTPGTALQLTLDEQLAAPLPDGDITAFGLYISEKGARYNAVDTFQIEGLLVPEPATAALLGAGLGLLLLCRRRTPRRP